MCMLVGGLFELVEGNMKSRYDTSKMSKPRSRSPVPEKGYEEESVLEGICKGVSGFHVLSKLLAIDWCRILPWIWDVGVDVEGTVISGKLV